MKTLQLFCLATIVIMLSGCNPPPQKNDTVISDPLDLWNEGPAKESIEALVGTVTSESSPDFLPPPDRVAVFDMDGTILLEKPNFVLFDFLARIIAQKIAANPDLKQKLPFKAFYEEDWSYFDTLGLYGDHGLYSILLDATVGYTEDAYREDVMEYLDTVIDQRYHKPYDQLVFAPMVQLIKYLEDNQFEVYIVSGSDPEFTRTFSEKSAGIPMQNVLGTTVLTKWVESDKGSYFVRVREFVEPINDEGGKPVNILNKVGRVPVIAVGNSAGDYPMLEYSKNAPMNLQMIVNHDDSAREYVYDNEKMKKMCQENGWQEISMKRDFKTIFKE